MKIIFNITLKKYKVLALMLMSIFLYSCDNYLDVNENPSSPTVAPIAGLLTTAEINFGQITDYQFFLGDILSTYAHQLTFREEQDQYGTQADNTLISNAWNNAYFVLLGTDAIINQGILDEELITVGMAQILKGYTATILVNVWGDVPYTEAVLLEGGIISPVFDNQETVYQAGLDLIDQGISNINSGTGINPGAQDLFYGGNIVQWTRFAKTLKLKLFNEIRNSSLFDAPALNTLVTEGDFMTGIADDFQFTYSLVQAPAEERGLMYLDTYVGTQATHYGSPWFYEILKGMNPNIHTGLEDPRIPYYFFNQLTPGQVPPDVGTPTNPMADYYDLSTGFHSIRFGSISSNRDFSSRNSSTYPGIYPAGGQYDDGLGGSTTLTGSAPGTGVAPHRILTYHEFLFIKAELMQEGLIGGSARTTLEDALNAAFAKVDQVVLGSGTAQTVPLLSANADVPTFITGILAEYDAASAAKQMEIIMTQKWVATFADPYDQYNDYRRTGYPVIADPNSAVKEYQLDNMDLFPLLDSETTSSRAFQLSLFWPQAELNTNQNAPTQKAPATYNIFWDN